MNASQHTEPHMALACCVPEAKAEAGRQGFFNWLGGLSLTATDRAKVEGAIGQARAAGVPWLKIIATLAPFILAVFTGGTLDIPALILAILALFQTPTPAPNPSPSPG